MTDDQLKKEFGKIKMSVSIHVQAKRVEKCVEIAKRYAEKKWIPIVNNDLSGLPDETVWITAINVNDNSAFVDYYAGIWLKSTPGMQKLILAWMHFIEPKPYRP